MPESIQATRAEQAEAAGTRVSPTSRVSVRARDVPARRTARGRRGGAPACLRAVGIAVVAGYSALMGIVVPFAAGALGSVTVSSPFLKAAVTLDPSTVAGRRTVRANAPYDRSTR